MLLRSAATLLLFVFLFALPFPLFALLTLGAMGYFAFYFEGIILFLLFDLFFGTGNVNFIFLSMVIGLTSFVFIELLKTRVRAA